MTAPGWDGILDEGESIVWQGRPDPSVRLRPGNIAGAGFGVLFAGFALFWMVMAAQAGGGFWMFGLIHFSVGIAIIVGAFLWKPWKRRHTWYTLTDRRAIVATDLPLVGRRLKTYSIDDRSPLELRGDSPGTVIFHTEKRRNSKGRTYTVETGFEEIADAPEVFATMQRMRARQEVEA